MTKTPNQSSSFFAVRKGKGGLQRCIFLDWNDCEAFVDAEEDNSVEFHVCDTVDQAVIYLKETPEFSLTKSTPIVRRNKRKELPQATTMEDAQLLASIEAIIEENGGTTTSPGVQQQSPAATTSPAEQPSAAKRARMQQWPDEEAKTRLRRPTEKWEEFFGQLKEAYEKHGAQELVDYDEKLENWIRIQRYNYRLLQQGKPSSMYQDKIDRLQKIGFVFQACKTEQNDDEWNEWFDKLQEYKTKHGDCNVTVKTDKELHAWVTTQRLEYKRLQQNKSSKLSAHRVTRLVDSGFNFTVLKPHEERWNERVEDLRKYKKEHGHVNVKSDHDTLGEWVSRQRREYRMHQEGKKTPMTPERIQILKELGFNFQMKQAKPRKSQPKLKSWDERFQELLQYKKEFGNTMVPKNSDYAQGLARWVKTQRMQHKKMLDGKKTTMTADRAQNLANIGFVFDATDFSRYKKGKPTEKETATLYEQRRNNMKQPSDEGGKNETATLSEQQGNRKQSSDE